MDISGLAQSDELYAASAGVGITANGPPLSWTWIVQHAAVDGLIRFILLPQQLFRLDAVLWLLLPGSAARDSSGAVIVEKWSVKPSISFSCMTLQVGDDIGTFLYPQPIWSVPQVHMELAFAYMCYPGVLLFGF